MTQREAIDILKLGHNVFLTGAAGSGKTYVLNQYIEFLKKKNIDVAVTASTGVAASHINGMTLNAWAGIGIHERLSSTDIEDILKRAYLRRRLLQTKVLIIDEVSMLPGYSLEMVDKVLRTFKNNDQPFGGTQVVLSGDFFQLPPVGKLMQNTSFAFYSPVWDRLNVKVCYLETEYRQEDEEFLSILNEIRSNSVSKSSIKKLSSRMFQPLIRVTPTRLYTHNTDVDRINAGELLKLSGRAMAYPMREQGDKNLLDLMRKSSLVSQTLVLKLGALVMFVKNNFEKGYANGTLGTVVNFDSKENPVVQTFRGDTITVTPAEWSIEDEGIVKAKIKQLPIRLAWAMTIHKSQGMNLDAAEIDLGRPFAPGMGYVALSRVRSLEGIKLLGLNHKALQVSEEVMEFDLYLQQESHRVLKELREIEWLTKQMHQSEYMRTLRRTLPINNLLPTTIF